MSTIKAGFSRVDITPPLGTPLVGYYGRRPALGILDPLYTTVIAVNDGENTALIISNDLIGIDNEHSNHIRCEIEKACGVKFDLIFLACTHTHMAQAMSTKYGENFWPEIFDITEKKIVGAAKMAIEDMKDAEMYTAEGEAPIEASFVRTFRMKDGTVATNPGRGNPAVDHPIGRADQRVALTCFKREGAPEIAIINFQTHSDSIGGSKISADYPYFVRSTYETVIPNSLCMFMCGAQGNTNVQMCMYRTDDMIMFDKKDEKYGPYTAHIGRVVACTAISLYGHAKKVDALPIRGAWADAELIYNKEHDEKKLEEFRRIKQLYLDGRVNEIEIPEGHRPMSRTAIIAEATKKLEMIDDNLPDTVNIRVSGVRIGELNFVGFPGEPFTEIGLRTREIKKDKMTFVACCTNGYEGYYPSTVVMEAGGLGYEYKAARYKIGTEDKLVEAAEKVLDELYK